MNFYLFFMQNLHSPMFKTLPPSTFTPFNIHEPTELFTDKCPF